MSSGKDRLYWREGRGWYMDLRDLGHGQKACIPEGKRSATKDRDKASAILGAALEEIEEGAAEEDTEDPRLAEYAKRHLEVKAQYRAESTVERDELSLRHVVEFFGSDVRLSEIDVEGLTDYLSHRSQQPGNRAGTTISEQTLLHELHALSSLYKRAVAENKAETNPVQRLPEKPQVERSEKTWLEPGEAARVIEAAGTLDEDPHSRGTPFLKPLLATFLLTGGRASEVFGLLRKDVEFDNEALHFRPNRYRGLKKASHRRWVPLWPQLEGILEEYLAGHSRDEEELLFPSPNGGMLSDIRASLSNVLEKAEVEKHVTLHTFRHTYAAQRLQTTDHGAAVSPYTVMRELGHSSIQLIEETYGHLQNSRHRAEVVEYREADVIQMSNRTGS